MLIKSLFNLDINHTANLPNQYFIVLEKQQKYKDLHNKLLILNLHNQNLIQSLSTIKTTLLQLIHDFVKPSEASFLPKIQQALISTFSNLDQVCSDLHKQINTKISNYESHIDTLSKQYKERLQQVTHYRKKVESIKKGPLETRQEKDKLNRNIEKKRTIQKQCQRAESLLIQNYQLFYQQSHEYLKTVPQQILFHLIENNFQTASKIAEIVGEEMPVTRRRHRKQSIMSSAISQISDADALSEYSEEDFPDSNEIKIISELESDQILNENLSKMQTTKNQLTFDDQNYSKLKSPMPRKAESRILKKSFLRRSSIEDQLRHKTHIIQKVKKLLEVDTFGSQKKQQYNFQLEKAFQNIEAPLTHEQKIKNIFKSAKNKFCDPASNAHRKKQNKAGKINLNSFHQKSFVLQKEEFKSKHSLRSIKLVETIEKRRSRNQETLNCPSDEENISYASPSHHENNASISQGLSQKNSPSLNENSAELSISQTENKNANVLRFQKNVSFKTNEKPIERKTQENKKIQPMTLLRHDPTFDHLPNQFTGSIQELRFLQQPKESKFGQDKRKKAMENLFSAPNQKINHQRLFEKNPFQSKPFNLPTQTNKKPENQLKQLFSEAFSSQMLTEPNRDKISQTGQINNSKINDQKSHPYTNQNLKKLPTTKQIDFSIFQKII